MLQTNQLPNTLQPKEPSQVIEPAINHQAKKLNELISTIEKSLSIDIKKALNLDIKASVLKDEYRQRVNLAMNEKINASEVKRLSVENNQQMEGLIATKRANDSAILE